MKRVAFLSAVLVAAVSASLLPARSCLAETPGASVLEADIVIYGSTAAGIACSLELVPSLAEATAGARYQFEREGYFCLDSEAGGTDQPVFNRIVSLRDSWGKSDAG